MQHRYRLPADSTLRQVREAWLQYVQTLIAQNERSASTLVNYQRDTRDAYLADLGDMPVRDIGSDDIIGWHEELCARTSSARAYSVYTALRVLLSYARRRGVVQANVACRLQITHKAAPARPLLPEEIAVWRQAHAAAVARRQAYIDTLTHRDTCFAVGMLSSLGAVKFLELTGRRLTEGCQIRVEGIQLSSRCIVVPSSKTGQTCIPLGPQTAAFVAKQLALVDGRSPWLFPSPDSWERPIRSNTVWDVFHRICGEAGIHGASPHDFRHGWIFTGLMLEDDDGKDLPLEHVSEGAGHKLQSTTRRRYGAGVVLRPGMLRAAAAIERAKQRAEDSADRQPLTGGRHASRL